MSRICGVVAPKLRKEEIRPIVRRMTTLMKHEDWHRVDEWCDDGVGLGHLSIGAVNEEPQPLTDGRADLRIVTAGKIFGYEGRKRELRDKGYCFSCADNDAEFILALYREQGVRFLRELNGILAFALWDNSRRELVIVNDRYGFRPLYYHYDRSRNIFFFASEIKAISHQPFFEKKIDWEAWNVFFRMGFLVGEDTFFEGLSAFPQGTVLRFGSDGVLRRDNYWNYRDVQEDNGFSEDDLERLVFLFRQALKRRLLPGKKACVFLSGGLDSRTIAAGLEEQGLSFQTYTTRKFFPRDQDRKIASLTASRLGVENHFIDLPGDFLEKTEPEKNALLDFESDEHTWLLPLIRVTDPQLRINYDGIGQDVMADPRLYLETNNVYIDLLQRRNYRRFIREWFHGRLYQNLVWPLEGSRTPFYFLSPSARKRMSAESFFNKMEAELRKWEGKSGQYIYFSLDTRTRREISLAPFQLILNKMESFCPYFDNDYFDFLMSIVPGQKMGRILRSQILSKINPSLAILSPAEGNDGSGIEFHSEVYEAWYKESISIIMENFFSFLAFPFNACYLFPRMGLDLMRFALDSLLRLHQSEARYRNSHAWLFRPLSFFRDWLRYEGIRVHR